jgi:ADP-ribose pyrophosphatase YjhB (NUDIX family)
MRFLRLATNCAVFDDEGRVLLSKRGDLNVWNLPGGRLDSGEALASAAAREVREETGIIAHVERAVGLYYAQGWDRLNILYTGFPVGGDLLQKTFETRENRFFSPDSIPEKMLDNGMVRDAAAPQRPIPQIIMTPPSELRRVKWALRRRYISNLLRGHPEPRHVRFNIQAAGVVWEKTGQRILTLSNGRMRSLPRVVCNGSPPWKQLEAALQRYADAAPLFQWAGVWQYPETDTIEFIFAATIRESETKDGGEWSTAYNGLFNDRDTDYVKHTPPDYAVKPVWSLIANDSSVTNTVMLK